MTDHRRLVAGAGLLSLALSSTSGCDSSLPPRCAGSAFECPEETARWPMRTTAPAVYRTDQDTVLDTGTGLMWQRKTPTDMFRWDAAQTYCEELALGGQSDWRLPSRLELVTLVEYERIAEYATVAPSSPPGAPSGPLAPPAVDTTAFPDTPPAEFWSASHYEARDGDVAWTVSFRTGQLAAQPLGLLLPRVRCVRDTRQATSAATSTKRFGVRTETATDGATGLVWQRRVDALPLPGWSTDTRSMEGAQAHCAGLELDGMTGFRLPHVKELLTLAAATGAMKHAIDTDVFDVPKSYWYGRLLTSNPGGTIRVGRQMTLTPLSVDFSEGGTLARSGISEFLCVKGGTAGPTGPLPPGTLPPGTQP